MLGIGGKWYWFFVGSLLLTGLWLVFSCCDGGAGFRFHKGDENSTTNQKQVASSVGVGRDYRHQHCFAAMGTQVCVHIKATVVQPESSVGGFNISAAFKVAEQEAERLEAALSEWRPDSELSRINRSDDTVHVLSTELAEILILGQRIAQQSQGAFALSWKSLDELWRFGEVPFSPPAMHAVNERLRWVDDASLRIKGSRLQRVSPKQKIGIAGIAKGYIAERIMQKVVELGYIYVLVEAGGDVVASAAPPQEGWRVGIESKKGEANRVIELYAGAVMSSGAHLQSIRLAGKNYHHILDPRTGYPALDPCLVTARAASGAVADAWATALVILGPVKGKALAEQYGIEALWQCENGIYQTTQFPNIQVLRQSP